MLNKKYESAQRHRFVAPAGGVKGGNPYLVGSLFGICVADQKEGKEATLDREGQWTVAVEAKGGQIKAGDKIYWKAGRANAEFTNEAVAGNRLVGAASCPNTGLIPADGVLIANNTVKTICIILEPHHSEPLA